MRKVSLENNLYAGVQGIPQRKRTAMKYMTCALASILCIMLLPFEIRAAAAPHKVIYTFGGLNERSGILWVAAMREFFRSMASIRPSSTSAMPGRHVGSGGG
jgi:hypothetical protein